MDTLVLLYSMQNALTNLRFFEAKSIDGISPCDEISCKSDFVGGHINVTFANHLTPESKIGVLLMEEIPNNQLGYINPCK